jgi:hypothetical protein
VELQYTVDILCQHKHGQEPPFEQPQQQNNPHPQPPPPLHMPIPHPLYPPPPIYDIKQQPLAQYDTTDPKSPLADCLQLAPWPPQYRAAPLPKYHNNTDPRKFLMCYKANITSVRGDDATLAKSLIISLEDVATNWYSRLHQDSYIHGSS